MLRRFRKRHAAALAIIAVLAIAGGAYAYFTSSGTGSSNATVGSSKSFTVSVGGPTGGPLYPGSGSETLSYTIANPGGGSENLSAVTTAVASEPNGDITQGGNDVPGCLASWFALGNSGAPATPQDLAPAAQVTGSVTVTMNNANAPQDPCQGAKPDITVNAS
jgi:hypothetical protein